MLKLFKSKPILDGFYEQNKIAPEKEPLLNIGAMLLEYNQYQDSLTLKSRLKPDQMEPLLNSAWNIMDKFTCVQLLEELSELPCQAQNNDYINAILLQRKNINRLTYEVLINPAYLYGCLQRNCESLFEKSGASFGKTQFDAIGNLAAWDIERAGLIIRYAYNIGWLTEFLIPV